MTAVFFIQCNTKYKIIKTMMTGALSHIRVLDLSRILAGPWAGQSLADLGADVIKVEKPQCGDDTRSWGPPYIKNREGEDDLTAYFASTNRNKKSITINISQPEGQDLIRRLVSQSDVILENYKVGTLAKYGLDYNSLKVVKPDIIYCSITGFGQTGPYAARPGYDILIQAMGGLMSITGEPDNKPGGGPIKAGVALVDILTGLYANIGVLAALAYRDKTGQGQHIDLSLLDVQVASLANQALNYLVSKELPQRRGNRHPNIVPYQSFATLDGHIILAIGNNNQFVRFCAFLNQTDLAEDVRFKTNKARVHNREILIPILKNIIKEKTTAWWVSSLEQHKIPGGPINTIDQTFADPQVQHREMKRMLERSDGTQVPNRCQSD